jgi:hypothetical protein
MADQWVSEMTPAYKIATTIKATTTQLKILKPADQACMEVPPDAPWLVYSGSSIFGGC